MKRFWSVLSLVLVFFAVAAFVCAPAASAAKPDQSKVTKPDQSKPCKPDQCKTVKPDQCKTVKPDDKKPVGPPVKRTTMTEDRNWIYCATITATTTDTLQKPCDPVKQASPCAAVPTQGTLLVPIRTYAAVPAQVTVTEKKYPTPLRNTLFGRKRVRITPIAPAATPGNIPTPGN